MCHTLVISKLEGKNRGSAGLAESDTSGVSEILSQYRRWQVSEEDTSGIPANAGPYAHTQVHTRLPPEYRYVDSHVYTLCTHAKEKICRTAAPNVCNVVGGTLSSHVR